MLYQNLTLVLSAFKKKNFDRNPFCFTFPLGTGRAAD